MTISELKLKLFRQIDSLDKSRLEDLYGVLLNYMNEQKDINDWGKLSEGQQQGIDDAIKEVDAGKGIPNDKVMTNIRRKYQHD